MGTDKQGGLLSPMEIDAIGEVLNISMGSAATAVSSMLDKQVVITTPNVEVASLGSIDSGRLEPAVLVKITYTEGITGSNVMIYRQRDIQMILNGLMGIDEPPAEDFVFDELSMSAACEVMNQMMGASATALADFLGIPVNISTPEATIMDEQHTFIDAVGLPPEEEIVSILFNLSIKDTMNTEFVSVLSIEFAQELINRFMVVNGLIPDDSAGVSAPAPAQAPAARFRHLLPLRRPRLPRKCLSRLRHRCPRCRKCRRCHSKCRKCPRCHSKCHKCRCLAWLASSPRWTRK